MTSGFQQQQASPFDYVPRRAVPAQQHGARFNDLTPTAPKPATPPPRSFDPKT